MPWCEMTVAHLWLEELDTGNVVSCNVSDLNAELADLKADGGLAALNNKEEGEAEGKAKGALYDRFTKEMVV